MTWMGELLAPDTFPGAVFATVIGTVFTAVMGWLLWQGQASYRRHFSLDGLFSDESIDHVAYRDFSHGHRRGHVLEGEKRRICLGVRVKGRDLHLRTINIRPMERRWGRWRNLTEPRAVHFTKIAFSQVDLQQRGYSIEGTMNPWHDGLGGFTCQLRGDNFSLEAGAMLWCEIEADARRAWDGVISMQGKLKGGDVVLCRCHLSVVGDHNMLNDG